MNALPRKSQTLWCYIWPRISINPFIIDPSLKSPQTNSKVSENKPTNLPPVMLNQVWCCKPVHRSFCYPFKNPSSGLWHWHAQMWSITLHRGFSVSSLVFEKLWCSFCRSGWWITAWLFFLSTHEQQLLKKLRKMTFSVFACGWLQKKILSRNVRGAHIYLTVRRVIAWMRRFSLVMEKILKHSPYDFPHPGFWPIKTTNRKVQFVMFVPLHRKLKAMCMCVYT